MIFKYLGLEVVHIIFAHSPLARTRHMVLPRCKERLLNEVPVVQLLLCKALHYGGRRRILVID